MKTKNKQQTKNKQKTRMDAKTQLKHIAVLSDAMSNIHVKHMTITECFQLRKLAGIILTDNTNTRHNSINDNLENYTEKEKDSLLDWLVTQMEEFDDAYSRNEYLDRLATKYLVKKLHDYKANHD